MRVRDVDGDGDTDIVVTAQSYRPQSFSQWDFGVYWYENTGGMNFTEHKIGNANAWKVDCFDDEGDGHLEIVVSECSHGSSDSLAPCRLIFYKNNGSELFTPIVLDSSFPAGFGEIGAAGVRCADFDEDGKTDIICGDISNGKFYWYKNNGGSSFTRNTLATDCPNIDGMDVGDFQPDGHIDIAVAGRN
ncbi:MAG: hypothetical protein COT09_04910, partial [Candidatus Hydromicrobium americanum]